MTCLCECLEDTWRPQVSTLSMVWCRASNKEKYIKAMSRFSLYLLMFRRRLVTVDIWCRHHGNEYLVFVDVCKTHSDSYWYLVQAPWQWVPCICWCLLRRKLCTNCWYLVHCSSIYLALGKFGVCFRTDVDKAAVLPWFAGSYGDVWKLLK